MNIEPSRPMDFSGRDDLLKDPCYAAIYLEECLQDGDMELFQEALQNVVRAQGGMTALAKQINLNRESLYKSLSRKGNPKMETINKVLNALGIRFSVTPIQVKTNQKSDLL